MKKDAWQFEKGRAFVLINYVVEPGVTLSVFGSAAPLCRTVVDCSLTFKTLDYCYCLHDLGHTCKTSISIGKNSWPTNQQKFCDIPRLETARDKIKLIPPRFLLFLLDIPLSKEDSDALQKLLHSNNINLTPTPLTIEQAKQQLQDRGFLELASQLRTKLDEGWLVPNLYVHVVQ